MRLIWYRSGDPDSLQPGMKKLIFAGSFPKYTLKIGEIINLKTSFMRIAHITMCMINPKSASVVTVFPLLTDDPERGKKLQNRNNLWIHKGGKEY